MTLLANVLSVALSGLLYEDTVLTPTAQNFTTYYQLPLNGQSLPNSTYDHFYVAMSNVTAGTPLPAWIDATYFYVPFDRPILSNKSSTVFRARTPAISASLDCVPLQQTYHNGNLTWEFLAASVDCDLSVLPTFSSVQAEQPEAIEYATFSRYKYTRPCDLKVLAGWGRSTTNTANGTLNATWIGCKPQIQIEIREVTVDDAGMVQTSSPTDEEINDREQFFNPNSTALIESVHTLLDYSSPKYPYTNSNPYHNDSNPSDFWNYLMIQALNSSTILDPVLMPPTFNTTMPVLKTLYSKLFAIVLGTHIPTVLRALDQKNALPGSTLAPEVRIFVSTPMFITSVTIIAMYVVVTVILYVRRPWKILPRMPTTIASQIAYFAASHALNDFSDTSSMSAKEREQYVCGLKQRYGFGRYVGTDGKPHIGIEREPLVQVLTKKDLESMQTKQVATPVLDA